MKNAEYEYVVEMCRKSGVPITTCPTCRSRHWEYENADHYGWQNGTYRYQGEEHACDCETQIQLRKHYLLANIGEQYQRLDWANFYGSSDATDAVALFLDKWESVKVNGMGLEFSSPAMGVGKTFAATHVGKELVKRGESVYFLPFLEIINLYTKEQTYRDAQENRLRDSTVLILDEVRPAVSDAQRQLFGNRFEELIRYRTNFNRVTIMTTNLTPDQLHGEYPRTYSLLEAKQIRVEMKGEDARQTVIAKENIELIANDEVRPIT